MAVYWFWFLFPTVLSIIVTTFEIHNMEHKEVQPRFGLIFFILTGIPALLPGWTVFYSGVSDYLAELLIPAVDMNSLIADFTITAAMLILLSMHCVLVFALIPLQLAKLIQRLRKA